MPETVNRVHYGEIPPEGKPIIYLFGPADFRTDPDWHLQAWEYLTWMDLSCTLCLPTPRDGVWRKEDKDDQSNWQFDRQDQADIGVFWVPRLAPMTFIEFGAWCEKSLRGRKAVLGLPDDIPRTDGLIDYAHKYSVPRTRTLPDTLELTPNILP